MEYGDRWQKAKAAATDADPGLGPAIARRWCFFSSGAEVAVRSARPIAAALESGVARRRQPGPGRRRYAPALKLAGSLLGESALPAARDRPDQRLPAARLGADARPRRRASCRERTTLTPVNVASGRRRRTCR